MQRAFFALRRSKSAIQNIDCSEIAHIDTAGMMLLQEVLGYVSLSYATVQLQGLSEKFTLLFSMVEKESAKADQQLSVTVERNWIYRLGENTTKIFQHYLSFFAFIGEFFFTVVDFLRKPFGFNVPYFFQVLDDVGVKALGIIALMTFLIGVVLAYQIGLQLRIYGANTYIVQLSGVTILREFGPLITAIIMAGRTSTAFAALIGTMKVNEELDALRVMGKTPIFTLVFPRVLGLFITLPLLTVWANVFGILGCMLMAKSVLGISYPAFITQFQVSV